MARRKLKHQVLEKDGELQPSANLWLAPWPYILTGFILLGLSVYLMVGGPDEMKDSEEALVQGQTAVNELRQSIVRLRNVLGDENITSLGARAIRDSGLEPELLAALRDLVPEIDDVHVYGASVFMVDLDSIGDNGYILLDLMASAQAEGIAPVQLIEDGGEQFVASATSIMEGEEILGFIVIFADPQLVLSRFNVPAPKTGYIALEHRTGGNSPVILGQYGTGSPVGYMQRRLRVSGSLFQVVVPQSLQVTDFDGTQRIVLALLGVILLVVGLVRRHKVKPLQTTFNEEDEPTLPPTRMDTLLERGKAPRPGPPAYDPQPEPRLEADPEPSDDMPAISSAPPEPDTLLRQPDERPEPEPDHDSASADKTISLSELQKELQVADDASSEVELDSTIFRAYDIRGIVGKSLDAGIAFKVGQAIGSLALDSIASPVVVGRDGRHSGPELSRGMVEGIASTGCDVIDVGAVPTGALYYASYELGKGSGVMVTGSHNPPEYNGIKIMIGGKTLAGDNIYGLYERIRSENLRRGQGEISEKAILDMYRERIAGDIQLSRPLKVVADCGNGIGGSCATEILQAIGAEVIPLYDDVDGDFPNHHPDPSEPENMRDLIESVRLMDADLGVAFDGDADRLGVVTPDGAIVFADRIMMLYAQEILSRNPGSTIIYDVKCTGHLDRIIQESGGMPEMYKTGHSLIKNRMKEVHAPFAGEMSGHFFFKDRWYGFDCGIYSAARLLEILANDERTPQEVLDSLPNSVSTPELKVKLEEGENHAFVEKFQAAARFEGAKLTTIDGVRADFSDGWGLCRASNTTPILVLRFDADNQEALTRVQEAFREQMLAINPDLDLPF